MAVKLIGQEYCDALRDIVCHYIVDTDADIANLPQCCTSSTAMVLESGTIMMVNAVGEWVPFGG